MQKKLSVLTAATCKSYNMQYSVHMYVKDDCGVDITFTYHRPKQHSHSWLTVQMSLHLLMSFVCGLFCFGRSNLTSEVQSHTKHIFIFANLLNWYCSVISTFEIFVIRCRFIQMSRTAIPMSSGFWLEWFWGLGVGTVKETDKTGELGTKCIPYSDSVPSVA